MKQLSFCPLGFVIGALLLTVSNIRAGAKELFVDTNAATAGNGSAGAPFKTISEAVKSAPDGGTITIRAGVYRETVEIHQKKTETPLIIHPAEGDRVVVTGFDPVKGWKEEGKGLYGLITQERVNELYVGGVHQRLARFPDSQSAYAKVIKSDTTAGSVQLDQFPKLAAGEEKSLCLFVFCTGINAEGLYRIKTVDPTNKTVSFPKEKWAIPKIGDAALLFNAPSFVKYPGEWVCMQTGEHSWKTVFFPKSAKDLELTETRMHNRSVVFDIAGSSNVVLEGLEISGGMHRGIWATQTDRLQIKHCAVYDNGVPGIYLDSCTNSVISSSIIFFNHHGIGVYMCKEFTLEGCEVACNEEDGIDVCGRGLQDPKAPACENVTLRNNYFHGHVYLAHPDNTQAWGNVKGLTYEKNLIMLGGASGTLEDLQDLKLIDNVMLGSGCYHFFLGGARGMHTADHNVEFSHNIIAYGGLTSIYAAATAHDLKYLDNVFFQNRLAYDGSNYTSGGNLFWGRGADKEGLILSRLKGKLLEYTTVEAFNAVEKDLEVKSTKGNPQFKNVPVCLLRGHGFVTGPNALIIQNDPGKSFAAGDIIEVQGDGIARKIESVDGQKITFTPPLPSAPFRDLLIWNWGANTNLQIDLRSPLVGGKNQPGTYLNVAAYQRGELDGSGRRSLPALSPELKAIMGTPTNFVFPYFLYLEARFE